MSLLLLRGGHVFAPEDRGVVDVLAAHDRILAMGPGLQPPAEFGPVAVIDAAGRRVIPGLVDQHVHFLGGGDGDGPAGRVPELQVSDLVRGGTTTAVGLLGVDMEGKTLAMLLRKTHELDRAGITALAWTGSMRLPAPCLTGSVRGDIILLDKVVGAKCAIAERYYPNLDFPALAQLAGEVMQARSATGRAAPLLLHVGRLAEGMRAVFDLIERCGMPADQVLPTHINRREDISPVFAQAIEFARLGGTVDITCCLGPRDGIPTGIDPVEAVRRLLAAGVDAARITLSTDAQVSVPADAPGRLRAVPPAILFRDVRRLVHEGGLSWPDALAPATVNVARVLGLAGRKGRIVPGADADMVVLDADDRIETVIARGRVVMQDGTPLLRGMFEA